MILDWTEGMDIGETHDVVRKIKPKKYLLERYLSPAEPLREHPRFLSRFYCDFMGRKTLFCVLCESDQAHSHAQPYHSSFAPPFPTFDYSSFFSCELSADQFIRLARCAKSNLAVQGTDSEVQSIAVLHAAHV